MSPLIDTTIICAGLTHYFMGMASIWHPEGCRRISSLNVVIVGFFDKLRMTYV